MAKLELSVDTNTRECRVSVDGVAIDRVYDVSVYLCPTDAGGDARPHFSVTTSQQQGDMVRREYLQASAPADDAVARYLSAIFGVKR